MNDDGPWMPLRAELKRWESAGRRARLWLRDDDAVEVTDTLERLLDATGRASVPLTLAVIPAFTDDALATRLARENQVLVAVHGWSHANYASANEKKQELGRHRPAQVVLSELRNGLATLRHLHGQRLVPMLVPPWNRINEDLVPWLGQEGFEVLSVFGRSKENSSIRVLNTHVDVVNARGQRGSRSHGDLVAELVGELQARFVKDDEPIGILTHHLVHGTSEWRFLDRLFDETAGHPGVTWSSAHDLLS